jgi:CHAT domain-containing protein
VLFALRREGVEGGRRGASFQAIVVPATRADLTDDVRWLRDAIQEKDPEDLVIHQAAELYDLLIRPAEALMAPGDALLIAPDGPLNSLPFSALVREDEVSGRSFLVEQRPLHFVVSASVYAQLAQPLRDRREEEPMLVAFGDPDYGATAPGGADVRRSFVGRASDLTPLPHARREVESIAQLFTESSRIHLGAQATEARAKSLGERVDYVHFACHGVLDERFPLGSALAMALPRSTEQSDDNGFLQAWEIIEQVRVDADLVTLSACETGLGVDMGGEGLVGLVRAFQYAGARSVIASLWKVADRPTADLMQHLYSSLQSGKSKAGALRDAQLSLIRNGGTGTKQEDGERGVRRLVGTATDEAVATSHPYYWAAFQLFGAR